MIGRKVFLLVCFSLRDVPIHTVGRFTSVLLEFSIERTTRQSIDPMISLDVSISMQRVRKVDVEIVIRSVLFLFRGTRTNIFFILLDLWV